MNTKGEKPARVVTYEYLNNNNDFKGIQGCSFAQEWKTQISDTIERHQQHQQLSLLDMPDDVLYLLFTQTITHLSLNDLLALACSCHRLFNLVFRHSTTTTTDWNNLWRSIFSNRWPISSIQIQAALLAGSWQLLYREKHTIECTNQNASPFWSRASSFEIEAFIHSFFHTTTTTSTTTTSPFTIHTDTSITFLVDGSGSVTMEDFKHIQDFIITTHHLILSQQQHTTNTKKKVYMSIVQFANEYRIELNPTLVQQTREASYNHDNHHRDDHNQSIEDTVRKMRRMNGGTHIEVGMTGAHQVIRMVNNMYNDDNDDNDDGPSTPTPTTSSTVVAAAAAAAVGYHQPPSSQNTHNNNNKKKNSVPVPRKVVVLITDGRIDSFQTKEATDMIQRMREEEEEREMERGGEGGRGKIIIKVVGVGRGIDEGAMLNIIGGERPEDNYLGLCTLDELVW